MKSLFFGLIGLALCGGGCAADSRPTLSAAAELPASAPNLAAQSPKPLAKPNPKPRLDYETILKKAAETPPTPLATDGHWRPLFDGKTLTGWKETDFAGHGEVECLQGMIVLKMGDPFTGLNWTNETPKSNYEITLEAMRLMGTDFFCGLTVPVETNFCSLIVGGWGGALTGISSIDGMDASENETTQYANFETGRWYRIRLRVTSGRIESWIDDKKIADVVTNGKRISLRPGEIEESKPLGVACWQTASAIRNIQIREVTAPGDPPKKHQF
jgi:hypothetical protein